MSGINRNKKTQFFCFKSDEKKIEIYFLFNVFKIKKKKIVQKFWNLHERSGIGWNERKIKFPILQLLFFWSYCRFCTQNDLNFRWIFTHSSKNKIVEFFYYFSHSVQHIPHLSENFHHFWGVGEVFLDCDRAYDFLPGKKSAK